MTNNTATQNTLDGFILDESNTNTLSNNIATSNARHGFLLYLSNINTMTGNVATSNSQFGLLLHNSTTSVLSQNVASNNIYGNVMDVTDHGIISINGNTEFASQALTESWPGDGSQNNPYILANYFINAGGPTGFSISNTDVYFTIKNSWVNGTTDSFAAAVVLDNVIHGYLTNMTATNGFYGFYLRSSSNNSLSQNTAISSIRHGFILGSSSNNSLSNNTAISNVLSGFYLFSGSNDNTLSQNIATSNTQYGFYLFSGSNDNKLYLNIAIGNQVGLFAASSTNHNFITQNRFLTNTVNDVQDNSLGTNAWFANSYGDFLGSVSTPYLIPGTANAIDLVPMIVDSDQDGMPDWFEQLYGFDPLTDDSTFDPDNDGYTNLNEFHLGINPLVSDAVPLSTSISTTTEVSTSISTTTETGSGTTITGPGGTTTVTTQGTETITKTAEGFGLVLLGLSFVAFVISRRKK